MKQIKEKLLLILLTLMFVCMSVNFYNIIKLNADLNNYLTDLQEQIDENRIRCGWDAKGDAKRKQIVEEHYESSH